MYQGLTPGCLLCDTAEKDVNYKLERPLHFLGSGDFSLSSVLETSAYFFEAHGRAAQLLAEFVSSRASGEHCI